MPTADYGLLQDFEGIGGARKEAEDRALQTQLLQAKLQASLQGGDLPAAVQEYQYYNDLDPQSQAKYLQMKRADKIIDTGGGFSRFDPITGQAIPVGGNGSGGGQPLTKTFDPEEQRKADEAAREAQDQFNRGLDVQKKALAATERLIGRPNPETGELEGGNIEGVRANRGGLSTFIPNVSNAAVDAEADLTALTNLLTTENLGLLKGILSDTDMRVLASIGAGELAGSDKKTLGALRRMREALSGKVSGMQSAKENLMPNQLPPLASEFIDSGEDEYLDLDKINNLNLNNPKKLGSIPSAAAQYLKQNPQAAADFDAKYGAGASRMVLGK